MLCILCLGASDRVIPIFEKQGLDLNVSNVIIKHFWLQPNQDDENARVICHDCWNALDSFHKFYEKVEAAHHTLLIVEHTLKEEEKESIGDQFDTCNDSLTTDVKLEVKEDSLQDEALLDTQQSEASVEDSDSDSEAPLATLVEHQKSENNPSTLKDHRISLPKRQRTAWKKANSDTKKQRANKRIVDHVRNRELSREYDRVIEENMKLSCDICHEPIKNFYLLRKHFNDVHGELGYATCCGRKFRKRGILVDHIYLHLNPEHFKCSKCGRVLADRRSLEVHMFTHDTTKERKYQCEECDKSFYRKLLLDRHMYTHIPDRKFTCDTCQKQFSSRFTLRQHVNNVHNTSYLKICEHCGKSIRGLEAFQRHQLEHTGEPLPAVQCEKCGVKLRNKYGLKRHMETLHPVKKVLYVCTECGKIAPSAPALQRHMSYMHQCERSHKCPMCEKAFKKPGNLREHMTTHTGEVLYTCPHCPKTFNSNANMHSHRKKMHRTEWEANRRHPHMGSTERRIE